MISVTLAILAQAETSTPTWAVLMLVLSALIAAVFAVYRGMTHQIGKAQGDAKASESKLADSRHSEMKTLVGSVGNDVQAVGHRMDKIEGRVNGLEVGHAKLHQQVAGLNKGAENE